MLKENTVDTVDTLVSYAPMGYGYGMGIPYFYS